MLSRRPDTQEVKIVTRALAAQRELFEENPESAKKVVRVGESKPRGVATDVETAAWTMIANLILNLDETVTRN